MREPYTVEQALADYQAVTTGKMPDKFDALADAQFNEAVSLLCELAQLYADSPGDPKALREMDNCAGEIERLLR